MSRENGDNNSATSGGAYRETLLKEFQTSAVEIEDLMKTCIREYRVSVSGYEIQTLIKEWKSLYFSVFACEATDEIFTESEIGKELAKEKLYENLLKG